MPPITLAVFDLSGTTIKDETAVSDCLLKATLEFGLDTTRDELLTLVGTNKIHLYQYLIARRSGTPIPFEEFERNRDPRTEAEATKIFHRYSEIMLDYYRNELIPMPGAEETFAWCHDHGIRVATDTGFHRDINTAIIDGLGWVRRGLVDIAVDVEHTPNNMGRPAPFMIFHAMRELNIQSVHSVVKLGDTPADMLEGHNAGCAGVIGVLTGMLPPAAWGKYRHTHILPSVAEFPDLLEREFGV
jgi:phosphonatase-like hydrolase